MKKEEISNHIVSSSKAIKEYLSSNCNNFFPNNHLFIALYVDDSFDMSDYRSLINWANEQTELLEGDALCELIYIEQNHLSWVDFIPYKTDSNYVYSIVQLVSKGNVDMEVNFHISFNRFCHYPVGLDKYDFNYFCQVSEVDYQRRELLWRREFGKILEKYQFQVRVAKIIYRIFKLKIKIMDFEKEKNKINVFK